MDVRLGVRVGGLSALALLEHWVTIYPDHVPPTSLLREFIGGSSFGDA